MKDIDTETSQKDLMWFWNSDISKNPLSGKRLGKRRIEGRIKRREL